MRYSDSDSITFIDKDGVSHQLTDWRNIPEYETWKNIDATNVNQEFDEIASREEFYGEDSEFMTYALVDHNVIKLMENDFDEDNLKTIKVPILENIL